MPEERSGLRVVGIDALGRVDDELGAERAFDDERRAVGRASLAAVRLPAVLARLLVDGQQVRARRLIAEQDQQVAVEHRRAAVSPLNVERAVLLRQVPLPDDRAGAIERDDLSGAEPGEHQRAVGDRARRREVVLVVHRRQRAGRLDPSLPDALAVGAAERLDDEEGLGRIGARRGVHAERALALGGGVGALHQARMVALAPDARADLRGDIHAIAAHDGVETPAPAIGAFHATLSVALQRVGSGASGATPLAFGPRQCGQSAARRRRRKGRCRQPRRA